MKIIFSLLVLLALASPQVKADSPAVHGMALFGTNATYLSHLPMFHSPHNYQVVFKVSLVDKSILSTLAKYQNAKAQGNEEFTLVPELLDLTKIINGEITQFKANVFQGHFEKGGLNLGSVQVFVEKLILSAKLDPSAPEQSQYVLFGEKGEYYAAHVVNGKPNYDLILGVSQPFQLFGGFCRTRACAEPKGVPVADSLLPQTVVFNGGHGSPKPMVKNQLGDMFSLISNVEKIVYFEEQELAH